MQFFTTTGIILSAIFGLTSAATTGVEIARLPNIFESRDEHRACGAHHCLPCERISWILVSDGLLCDKINQDDTYHSVNDLFWVVSGESKPQLTVEGNKPNPISSRQSCWIEVKIPRAHKAVDWGALKGKHLPGRGGYFELINYSTHGSCWCTTSLEENRNCDWGEDDS